MKIVILASGEGIRMRPLTLTTPKPLLVYKGKTALDHIFDVLPDSIDEAIISVDYLGEQIKSYCGDRFHNRKISYVSGEKGGNALGFMKSKKFISDGERFAVVYADDILTAKEISDCLSNEFSWLCYEVKNPIDVGIVEIDENNFIKNFIEKPNAPKSNLVANGFMLVNTDIFSYTPSLHDKGEYYFSDLMAKFCNDHKVVAIVGDTNHTQLTAPGDIDRLNNTL